MNNLCNWEDLSIKIRVSSRMNSLMFPVSPTNGDTKEDKVDIVVESVERSVPFWIVPDAEIDLWGPIVLIIDVFSTYIDGCSCDSETYYPVCE